MSVLLKRPEPTIKMNSKRSNPQEDARWVAAYRQNRDAQAFGALYSKYFPAVLLYCRQKLGDQEEAFDITQDVFVKAATRLQNLRIPETFAAWLFQIARNSCLDQLHLRKRQFLALCPTHYELKQEEEPEVEERMAFDLQMEKLLNALDQLDENARKLLTAKYIEKQSIKDIARLLNIKESAVKMRLARTRQKLGKMLGAPV